VGQGQCTLEDLVSSVAHASVLAAREQYASCFEGVYRGLRVLVTGHTGFKGSWLALWLQELGADVYGYSLPAPTSPSHWEALRLDAHSELGDIRDEVALGKFVAAVKPQIVFHLAAQPLVRLSYEQPLLTYTTNVIGSLNVYEACRSYGGVRAIVSVTTDKVYENREWVWGYREDDPLGGHDPYSASKACADLATTSYRRSYWPIEQYAKTHHTLVCSARAGNVIGGGDWARDRLVPDLMRGAAAGAEAVVRNPGATRPWEHVLEPLSGYLLLGQRLLQGRVDTAQAWNFGPSNGVLTVEEVVLELSRAWPALRHRVERPDKAPHEAAMLTLDCARARSVLQWIPVWDGAPCFQHTASWYRAYYERGEVLSRAQLHEYVAQARMLGRVWVGAGR
jgi:CDP-glucose 4,6-dehydratase